MCAVTYIYTHVVTIVLYILTLISGQGCTSGIQWVHDAHPQRETPHNKINYDKYN